MAVVFLPVLAEKESCSDINRCPGFIVHHLDVHVTTAIIIINNNTNGARFLCINSFLFERTRAVIVKNEVQYFLMTVETDLHNTLLGENVRHGFFNFWCHIVKWGYFEHLGLL